MKKILLLLTLLATMMSLPAQDKVTVKFTAQTESGKYQPFTKVVATNVTRGWTETLVYPDTLLVMKNSTGVGEYNADRPCQLGTAFPNPFTGETRVPLELAEAGEVVLKVVRIDGAELLSRTVHMDAGSHRVAVSVSSPGLTFLVAMTSQGQSISKLVCQGHTGANTLKVEAVTLSANTKGDPGRGDVTGYFAQGDRMRYEALYEKDGVTYRSTVNEQDQDGDETVTLIFADTSPEPPTPSWPNGILPGSFSVSETQQVQFSQGNLQYIGSASTPYWKFADNQWEYFGNNGQAGTGQNVDRDLFGWGSNGQSHGAECYQPWSTGTNNSQYYAYGAAANNLYDYPGTADWGYNAIANGGDAVNLWRTLKTEEWSYLLDTRVTGSGIRYAKATVNDVKGLLILPDDWNADTYVLNEANSNTAAFDVNVISGTEWEAMQLAGAVFLPAASYRQGTTYDPYGALLSMSVGYYWSSTVIGGDGAKSMEFFYSNIGGDVYASTMSARSDGLSVRLVYGANSIGPNIPTVTTNMVTDITAHTATCGGVVANSGGVAVTARGVCWSTSLEPTLDNCDGYTTDGTGIGVFTSAITGLIAGRTYRVRAYARNSEGTSYGAVRTFTTSASDLPSVTTNAVHDISYNQARCGGTVTNGDLALGRGVCWSSTNVSPTVDDSHTVNGSGAGTFESLLDGLTPLTTYYVRAYVHHTHGTVYGEVNVFTTLLEPNQVPEGAINGMFSVDETGNRVFFSQGNLQYIGSASTPYWKFANTQWEHLGYNGQSSTNQDVDRDLLGWGTSDFNHGATCYQPWSTSTHDADYYAYGSYVYNLYDQSGHADWGYNAISNGGNTNNKWRTLTKDEWVYVFNTRSTTSGIRYAKANVCDVNGVILVPDDWNPDYYNLKNTNAGDAHFSGNTINASTWSTLEQHGAVFLPAAGLRFGIALGGIDSYGGYWSASRSNYKDEYNDDNAYYLWFNDSSLDPDYSNRRGNGFAVRLVCSVR